MVRFHFWQKCCLFCAEKTFQEISLNPFLCWWKRQKKIPSIRTIVGRCWVSSIELVLSTASSHGFVNIAFFEVVTLLCYVCFRSSRSSILRGRQLYTVNQNPEFHLEIFILVRQWCFSGNLPGTYTEGLWHVFDKVNFEQNWNINTFCHNPVVVGLQPVPLQHVSHFSIIDTVFIILWTWFRKVRNRFILKKS